MLDVPYNVKRALRLGRYKKNYKIKVYDVTENTEYIDLKTIDNTHKESYTIVSENVYFIHTEPSEYEFTVQGWIRHGISRMPIYVKIDSNVNIIKLTGGVPIPVGDIIDFSTATSTHPFSFGITTPERIRTTAEKEYAFTIDNDTIIKESVRIDERMVTGKYLEFGLCEGSSLEFQYFNHPNINGKELQVYISVEYRDNNNEAAWYDIPMGWYTVDQCPRQFSTGIYKVIAYNKLKSDYLDAKVNATLQEYFGNDTSTVYLVDIIDDLLKGYNITHYDTEEIQPDVDGDNYGTNTGGVSAYKYNSLTGDQGAFDPSFLQVQASITTSSNIYMDVTGYYADYEISPTYEDEPIRIDFNTDFDIIDENIKNYYMGELAKINTGTSIETIWDKIYNRSIILSNNVTLSAWGLQVVVIFNDNTKKVYSKTLYDAGKADGTFTDLEGRTFFDVKRIILFQPIEIKYMYPNNTIYVGYDYTNTVKCYGEDFRYPYSDGFNTCVTPTDANGDKIPFYIDPDDPDTVHSLAQYISVYAVTNMADIEKLSIDINEIPDVTLRELQTAVYETVCQYGKLDRETDLFTGVELNTSGLYPQDTLYPANNLYPSGNAAHPYPSTYLKLWTDAVGVQSFRYLIITYKTTETSGGTVNEVDKVLQRTVNANGTKDYNMSNNWLFRNLIWTEEEIAEYADALVEKMRDITWFPFEMWSVGLPYLETGDAIEITDKEGNTYTSYILNRQLNGIHNLQDTLINGELDIF